MILEVFLKIWAQESGTKKLNESSPLSFFVRHFD